MRVKYFAQLLSFFSALVPNGLTCLESCNRIVLNIQLGSEVLLPCTLVKSHSTEEATWSQTSSLLSIRPEGNVTFEDPRNGRVTVFPFLFSKGNFSILIHQFQDSDVGMYCCQLSHECHRIEIESLQSPSSHKEGLYYIAAGAGTLILLVVVFILICKCRERSPHSYYINSGPNQVEQRETERTERVESTKVDECDGEYEEMESDSQDYVNVPEKGHDGQNEETASQELDEDYVNTLRRSRHGDTDTDSPTENCRKRPTQGHFDCVYENDSNQKSKLTPKANQSEIHKSGGARNKNKDKANQSEINKSGGARNKNKDKDYQLKNPLYDQTPAHRK